jgi:uncharacterized protein
MTRGPETTLTRMAAFLAAHTTMTLVTVDQEGVPGAAAVFYAHDDRFNLYFLSEERTQHGQNLYVNPRVAATIQSDGQDWRTIQGLQLHGEATLVPLSEVAHAAMIYGRRYAFVGALLAGQEGSGVLTGPLARARFYVLRPRWLRLIDNSVRFGHKEEWSLEGTGGHPDNGGHQAEAV